MRPPRASVRAAPLAGLRVLVTGASSGIGRAAAEALVLAGARVAVVARRRDRLVELGNALPRGSVVPIQADVSRLSGCERAVARAVRALGGLDVLVNNAGVGQWMSVAETPPALFDRLVRTNVYAPFWLARAAIPHLAKGRRPAIVQVASALAHRAIPMAAAYGGSKAFLLRSSEALRLELAPRGIDVVVVSPGIIDTEFAAAMLRVRKEAGERGRPRGAPASTVADAIVRALVARVRPRELFPQRQGRVFARLGALAPELLDEHFAPLAPLAPVSPSRPRRTRRRARRAPRPRAAART